MNDVFVYAPIGLYRIARDGRILRANPALVHMLGYQDLAALLSVNLGGLFVRPEDRRRWQELMDRDWVVRHFETELRRADGTTIWVEDTARVVEDEDGPYYEGAVSDISDRKRTERALHESEEKYRSLYSSMREGVALHEIVRDGSGLAVDYRILDVNPAYEQMLGLPKEQVIGALASQAYGTGEAPYLDRYVKVAETREPATFEIAFDPLQKVFRLSVFSPAPERFATVFEDITEAKRLEQQFYQAQKMEAIGRLAGGISHDFNNLLTAILGYTDLALSQIAEDHPIFDDIEGIRKAAESATSLTRQLLAFSRRQVLQPKLLDLSDSVRETEKLLRRVIGEDIELVLDLAKESGPVRADPGQVEQVLMNLAVNARDAMPNGGRLTIATSVSDLPDRAVDVPIVPGRYVTITLTDTGCGMSPEVRARIFEPFFTTRQPGKGSGLGLATVYGIIKQSAGYIFVDSEPGMGTTFRIHLPEIKVADVQPEPASAGTSHAGSETILLVEDDDRLRQMAYRALQRYGYTVLTAAGPHEAILECQRHDGPIHAMITDMIMPGMSGRLLAEHLAPLRPDMAVLFTSGYPDEAIFHQGMLSPTNAFLQKPFTPDLLARTVRQILDKVRIE